MTKREFEVSKLAQKLLPKEKSKRAYWRFLLYPDSTPRTLLEYVKDGRIFEFLDELDEDLDIPTLIETHPGMELVWWYLDNLQIMCAISPLHDSDVKEDGSGELKKAHYHGFQAFPNPYPYALALKTLEPLGVKILKLPKPINVMERYLAHLDSPTKAPYDVYDIRSFGGYQFKYLGDRFALDDANTITEIIEELGIVYYADLNNELLTNHPELWGSLVKSSAHWNNLCSSRERMIRYAKCIPVRDPEGNLMVDDDGNVITRLMSSYQDTRRMIGRHSEWNGDWQPNIKYPF